ncbi:MAG: TldD/PmbA family protein [Candidatus Binatia bacterium]|nr:TldD/PmbA family protein [Candidatus Binatia bacterium]
MSAQGEPSNAVIDRALETAREAGASDADAVFVEWGSSAAQVRLGEVETVKMSRERRLGIRCFSGQASAMASTADLAGDAIENFVRDVVEMSTIVAADPEAGLPPTEALATDTPELGLADDAGDGISPDDRIGLATRCEKAALDADPRLTNSEGAEFSHSSSRVAYGSSGGFRGSYRTTGYGISVAPVATDGEEMQRDSWYDSSRAYADLADPESVGNIAAQRTLRRLNARKVPTQSLPVVFDPISAASLMRHLASAVCGGALYHRASFLLDKLGEEIASSNINVVDDGRLPGGLASRPFDGEGLATRRNVVVENGRLTSYLLDSYSARKLGMTSTGNASRSAGDAPGASPTNFYLAAGESTPEEIVGSVKSGLYVTSLSGFGVNGVTGDYSRGAGGLWIENGELTHAVEEVTIAGNLLEMFHNIQMLGNDLEFRAGVCAPTLLIEKMTLAGS